MASISDKGKLTDAAVQKAVSKFMPGLTVILQQLELINKNKQVAQWATIAHLRASIMFGDTIIDDAQRQVTLNLIQ